jgi:hypothetical protein
MRGRGSCCPVSSTLYRSQEEEARVLELGAIAQPLPELLHLVVIQVELFQLRQGAKVRFWKRRDDVLPQAEALELREAGEAERGCGRQAGVDHFKVLYTRRSDRP